jgi:hypothetical protein
VGQGAVGRGAGEQVELSGELVGEGGVVDALLQRFGVRGVDQVQVVDPGRRSGDGGLFGSGFGVGVAGSANPSPARAATDSPSAKKPVIQPLGPVEKLSVELPGYLTDAMHRQAAEDRTSVRYIVMRGLAALGFGIAPGDLVPDARRLPRKSKKR